MSKQITIYLSNQPGEFLTVVSHLADNGINIVGFHACATGPRAGLMQLVVEEHRKAFAVLRQQYEARARESPVICLQVPNVPGQLKRILSPLSENRINVLGTYQASGKDGIVVVLELESLEDVIKAGDLYAKAGVKVVELQGDT